MNLKVTFEREISHKTIAVSWQTYVVMQYTYWCTASGSSLPSQTCKILRPIRSSLPRTGGTSKLRRQDLRTTSKWHNSRKSQDANNIEKKRLKDEKKANATAKAMNSADKKKLELDDDKK